MEGTVDVLFTTMSRAKNIGIPNLVQTELLTTESLHLAEIGREIELSLLSDVRLRVSSSKFDCVELRVAEYGTSLGHFVLRWIVWCLVVYSFHCSKVEISHGVFYVLMCIVYLHFARVKRYGVTFNWIIH